MSILITGSSGFIGSSLLKRIFESENILAKFSLVIGVDTQKPQKYVPKNNQKFKFVKMDITHKFSVQYLFTLYDIKYVVHLAAYISVPESIENPLKYHDNVSGFANIVDACRIQDCRLVYASSAAVYGDGTDNQSKSPYAFTKQINDFQSELYNRVYATKSLGLTFFNVYGEFQEVTGAVVPALIDSVVNSVPFKLFGDGDQTRSFIHVIDVCDACLQSLEIDKNSDCFGKCLDVGGTETVSVNQLVQMVESISGKKLNVCKLPERKGDVKNSVADLNATFEVLKCWRPKASIRTELEKLLK